LASEYEQILEAALHQPVNLHNKERRNNCTGALASKDFVVFRDNFVERLVRLYEVFKDDEVQIQQIKRIATELAQREDYKWAGPYSELVAADFWIGFPNSIEVQLVPTMDNDIYERSLAKAVGKAAVDLDLKLSTPRMAMYLDVKSFIPTYFELTDKVFARLISRLGPGNILIGLDEFQSRDYLSVTKDLTAELRSGALEQGLGDAIQNRRATYEHHMPGGDSYRFRIAYADGTHGAILSTSEILDPYQLAKTYKYKFVDYYEKLLISEPSLLLFVVNPWFNREVGVFTDFTGTFYRSVARRVFMELTKDARKLAEFFDVQEEDLTIADVAKLITGLVFIQDNSVTQTGNGLYSAHIFLNPNATNRKLSAWDWAPFFSDGPKDWVSSIDDFEHDNY
jgi:hypothetical protein